MKSVSIVLLTCVNLIDPAQDPAPAGPTAYYRSLAFGRMQIKDVEDLQLVEIEPETLPSKTIAPVVRNGFHWRFQEDARPEASENMTLRVYAAPNSIEDDIVQYEWTFLGQTLRATVTLNAIRLAISLEETAANPGLKEYGTDGRDRVVALVSRILRLTGEFPSPATPYRIELPWPERLDEGVSFSSNANMELHRMVHWHDRVDAYVEKGYLYILIYKKPAQLMHFQDGSKWFPDDFRARVLQRALEQGKLPPIDDAKDEK